MFTYALRLPLFLSGCVLMLSACAILPDPFELGRKTSVYLSPEVDGYISLNSKPLSGARVVRTLDYDREYREEAYTDKYGAFSFKEKTILSTRPAKLFDETRVRQIVTAYHAGQQYLLWYHTPGSIKERSAIARRLGQMFCELTTPEKELLFRNLEKPHFPHAAFSICRWNDGLELESLDDLE